MHYYLIIDRIKIVVSFNLRQAAYRENKKNIQTSQYRAHRPKSDNLPFARLKGRSK